nr:SMC-Scp complex subunit ScpB [Desulfobacterales bacterium]
MDNLSAIIESLLFVSEEPLSISKIHSVLKEFDKKKIREAIEALIERYQSQEHGFTLKEVAGGFQFRTRPEYSEWIKRLKPSNPVRLSRPALETLTIIAYRQPVLRCEIEEIRGVDCGGTIRTLLEKKLIRVVGRKDLPGRPLIYGTTRQFLEVFDLKDITALPSLKELEEPNILCPNDSKSL